MKIGAMDLLFIYIVALSVLGPIKLPQFFYMISNALKEHRKGKKLSTGSASEHPSVLLEETQNTLCEEIDPSMAEHKAEARKENRGASI